MSEIALLGKKIGMTREFYKSGQLVPVTVLKVEKARVIQVIEEEKRGYKAVQLGYGKVKNSKLEGLIGIGHTRWATQPTPHPRRDATPSHRQATRPRASAPFSDLSRRSRRGLAAAATPTATSISWSHY